MPKAILSLVVDDNGHRELVISYVSDSDALPNEHEQEHRALAEGIVGEEGMARSSRDSHRRDGGNGGEGVAQREAIDQKG